LKIAAFTKYGRRAASTRQRLLQYVPYLEAHGFEISYHPLLDDDYVRSLATGGAYPKHRIAQAYARRLRQLLTPGDADLLWIYAELFPYLPGAMERLAFRPGKPVVYDFDDAFFHQYDDSRHLPIRHLLGGKLRRLISSASACCCGNEYLRSYAARFCDTCLILPTVVDTEAYKPIQAKRTREEIVIGWIGSPSTWGYVRPLLPELARLAASGKVKVRAVGAGSAATNDVFPGLELVEWSEATEIEEVRGMDIGIMPVPDEPWARGKSGYKLIQYGACGLPVVASPVGVNGDIVEHGRTGFLATSPAEWRDSLTALLSSQDLRATMGEAGRRRVVDHYSLAVHAPRLVALLEAVCRSDDSVAPGGDVRPGSTLP
jgi:glycosyltransferase involved in cell wall biosynthesis